MGNNFSTYSNEGRILTLPAEVIDIIVNKCNVKSVLTLRQVCTFTKTWVDNFPTAEKLMSKAEVRMGIDRPIVQRFNQSAPTFAVTSLSLDTSRMGLVDSQEVYEAMWNQYFAYWTPRLVSLEIQKEAEGEMFFESDHQQIHNTLRRFLQDCPRLKKVVFLRGFDWALAAAPLPQSFLNLTDLIIDGSDAMDFGLLRNADVVNQLFPELETNNNLKKLAVKVTNANDMVAFENFIDAQKNNAQLCMSIKMGKVYRFSDEVYNEFVDLVKASVTSECHVTFHLALTSIVDDAFLRLVTTAHEQLRPAQYLKFTNEQIKSLSVKRPLDDVTLLDLQHMEGLNDLRLENMTPQNLEHFRFPPNLKIVACGSGFPTFGYLPINITEITLYNIRCGLPQLERSLALLSNHCVNLEKLSISYACNERLPVASSTGSGGDGDRPTIQFRKLESLSLKAYIEAGDEQTDIARELILNRLKLDQIPLRYLALTTHRFSVPWIDDDESKSPGYLFGTWRILEPLRRDDPDQEAPEFHHNYLPLVDEHILGRLCEGPIGATIMFMESFHLSVPQDGIPVEERLQDLCKANIQKEIIQEGRGSWMRKYPKKDIFYWIG